MDNLTHSLIGVLLARASLPWVRSVRGALWAGILASNVPDIDLVETPFFADARLGYLVHHRGHTHTIVGALLLAVGVWAFARRDRAANPVALAVLTVVGVLLHIGADAWNNYGVHPFWPIENSWYYGDFIFILEPWLWVATLPLAWTMATRGWRVTLGVLGVTLATAMSVVLGPTFGVGWAALTAMLTVVQRRWDTLYLPTVLAALTLVTFGLGSWGVETDVRARLAEQRPAEEILDVALSPRPGVPWCWQGWLVSRDASTYHARSFDYSFGIQAPGTCAFRPEGHTAPLVEPDLLYDGALEWNGQFSAPVGELAALATTHCRVDAATRFLRVPYWMIEGDTVTVGDLRFDMEPGLGFAELTSTPEDTRGCGSLPEWRSVVATVLTGS